MTATVTTSTAATQWLYDEGAPRYEARAFGDYVADYVADYAHTLPLPSAYREFQYDPRGRELLHRYGSTCYGRHLSEMCQDCRTWAQFGD